jgi:hypothetical protein
MLTREATAAMAAAVCHQRETRINQCYEGLQRCR